MRQRSRGHQPAFLTSWGFGDTLYYRNPKRKRGNTHKHPERPCEAV